MKNIIIGVAFLIIILPEFLVAQKSNLVTDLSNRLNVGDTFIPPSSVQLMRGMDTKIDWKALENKVVLLDLFETSCGICIQTMPHLQELEKKHGDIFKVITVTPQSKEEMELFFEANEYLKEHQVNLSVIYKDEYIRKSFPHKSIPHSILLYKGMVQAITTPGFINSENILKLYIKGKIELPLKDDFGKGNLLKKVDNERNNLKAGTIFSGYQDGVNFQPWTFEQDSVNGLFRTSIFNTGAYRALLALMSYAKKLDEYYVPRMDKLVWKVKDSTIYNNFSEEPTDVWMVENAICYERYDRRKRPDSIQALEVLRDFELLYGVKVYMGKKNMPCLVLKGCPVVVSKGNYKSEKMTYIGSKVLATFLDYVERFPPVIDEVNVDTRILLEGYQTLDDLNKQLEVYGIRGEIENREIDVMILEEVDQ